MATRFIFDRKFKEEQDLLGEIYDLARKEPFPDKSTVHLYRFLDACFIVEREEQQKQRARVEEEKLKKIFAAVEQKQRTEEEQQIKTLIAEAPAPEGPTAELPPFTVTEPAGRREYAIQMYDNAVGIIIEKNDPGLYRYQAVEPVLSPATVHQAKTLYGRSFEKDNSLFDNIPFLRTVAQTVAKKSGIPVTDLLVYQLKYYLERDILGAGPLDPLLYDENVKKITCEGPLKPVKIEYAGLGMIETNISFKTNNELNTFLKRLAFATGRALSEESPLLEATFQGFSFTGAMGIGGEASRVTIRRLT